MNFETKKKIYDIINTVEHNGLNWSSSDRIFEILAPLFENDGYNLTGNYRGGWRRTNDFQIGKPYDFIAQNKINDDDYIGILIETKDNFSRDSTKYNLMTARQFFPRLIILTDSSIDAKQRRNILRTESTSIELIDLLYIKGWLYKINTEIDNIKDFNILIKAINDKLAQIIAEDPNKLYEIEWRDLERLLADILEEFNFKVELTPGSKDGGKDIILECKNKETNKSYIVEIKHWRSNQKVGQKVVKDFLNVIVNEKRNKGLLVSTFGFTDNAFETLTEIEKKRVRFGEKEKIVTLCKQYNKKRAGIWTLDKDITRAYLKSVN